MTGVLTGRGDLDTDVHRGWSGEDMGRGRLSSCQGETSGGTSPASTWISDALLPYWETVSVCWKAAPSVQLILGSGAGEQLTAGSRPWLPLPWETLQTAGLVSGEPWGHYGCSACPWNVGWLPRCRGPDSLHLSRTRLLLQVS